MCAMPLHDVANVILIILSVLRYFTNTINGLESMIDIFIHYYLIITISANPKNIPRSLNKYGD